MSQNFLFNTNHLPVNFFWLNQPKRFQTGQGLELYTDPETDFWQNTHYGFQRDDGHCLLTKIQDDFMLTTRVIFKPQTQYDQCGLIVRLDAKNWIKLSTEYENEKTSRLGSVVTNLGYSDWATQDITSDHTDMWYRIHKNGADFLLEHSYDGSLWRQLRIAHLHQKTETLNIGLYACSPIGENFWCRFHFLSIAKNSWE